MDKLLFHYEQELSKLRQTSQSFAQHHPQVANRIQLDSDPEVERLMQAIALLNARTAARIDDQYAGFTSALLAGQPLLRPFPACAIAQIDYGNAKPNTISNGSCIPRGAMLKSTGNPVCKFRTAYDIHIAPLTIADFRLTAIDVPSALRLPDHASTSLRLSIESTSTSKPISSEQPLRMYVNGAPSQSAAMMDTILMRTLCVCVEADNQWTMLPSSPFRQVGLSDSEALLPSASNSRLLSEYFCFPEKFNFIDIDLLTIAPLAPRTNRLALHLILPGASDILRSVTRRNILLGCTPIINLFAHRAAPIKLDATATAYTIIPDQLPDAEIYSIDGVSLLSRSEALTEFSQFEKCGNGTNYWSATSEEGNHESVSLIDHFQTPISLAKGALSVQLTCTNGDQPRSLLCDSKHTVLVTEVNTSGFPVNLIQGPTAIQPIAANAKQWKMISQMTELPGISQLIELLDLHAPPDRSAIGHLLQGLRSLEYRSSSTWISRRYAHGLEVRLTINEEAFNERSIYSFAQLMQALFIRHVHSTQYMQLIMLSASGTELLRGAPAIGIRCLI